MIYELLGTGRENARTGRELARALNCGIREIAEQISQERRQGRPICATSGEHPGYYLAKDAQELEEYCNCLRKRGAELFKTRRALVNVLEQIREGQRV